MRRKDVGDITRWWWGHYHYPLEAIHELVTDNITDVVVLEFTLKISHIVSMGSTICP